MINFVLLFVFLYLTIITGINSIKHSCTSAAYLGLLYSGITGSLVYLILTHSQIIWNK